MFCGQASEVVKFRVVLYCVCVKDVKVKCVTLSSLELAEANTFKSSREGWLDQEDEYLVMWDRRKEKDVT